MPVSVSGLILQIEIAGACIWLKHVILTSIEPYKDSYLLQLVFLGERKVLWYRNIIHLYCQSKLLSLSCPKFTCSGVKVTSSQQTLLMYKCFYKERSKVVCKYFLISSKYQCNFIVNVTTHLFCLNQDSLCLFVLYHYCWELFECKKTPQAVDNKPEEVGQTTINAPLSTN